MHIYIEIHYKAESRITQGSSFPLKGRRPEVVALEWWKQIKRNMSYYAELEKVIVDNDQDITQLVKGLEEREWNKVLTDDLPF